MITAIAPVRYMTIFGSRLEVITAFESETIPSIAIAGREQPQGAGGPGEVVAEGRGQDRLGEQPSDHRDRQQPGEASLIEREKVPWMVGSVSRSR